MFDNVEVSRNDLFSVCINLQFMAKDLITRAKVAIEYNDYVSYSWAREEFESVRNLINSPVFSDWRFARETASAQFPRYSVSEWINNGMKYEPKCVTFSDGSTIADTVDVPF